MKRFIIFALAMLFSSLCVQAQTPVVIEVDDDEVVVRQSDGGRSIVEFGGFGITLGSSSPNAKKHSCITLIDGMQIGFSTLTGVGYSNYPAGTADFMEQRMGKSTHFGLNIIGVGFGLVRHHNVSKLTLKLNFKVESNNYTFANNITLVNNGGLTQPVDIANKVKKSKLKTTYLGLPVGLQYRPVRSIQLEAYVYGSVLVGSQTKYKRPKTKADINGLRSFQAGVGGSLWVYNLGFYAQYSLVPLFRDSRGPEGRSLSLGIQLNFGNYYSKKEQFRAVFD